MMCFLGIESCYVIKWNVRPGMYVMRSLEILFWILVQSSSLVSMFVEDSCAYCAVLHDVALIRVG